MKYVRQSSIRHTDVMLSTIALLVFCLIGSTVASAGETLSEIIDNIRQNESLYKDLEVKLTTAYQLHVKEDFPGLISKGQDENRYVYQNGYIYLQLDNQYDTIEGQSVRRRFLEGYDGEVTRLVEPGGLVNIHQDRFEDPRLFRPHTLLLTKAFVTFPLSVYLEARTLKTYDTYKSFNTRVGLEGREMVDGLSCFKVRIDTWNDGQPPKNGDTRHLWLAIDRNYLPIRTVGYRLLDSRNIPIEVGHVDEFRELDPGIWFPFKITLTVYDQSGLRSGKAIPGATTEFRAHDVSLHPHYDISLFRDIPIPPQSTVYELKEGKIIRGYVTPLTIRKRILPILVLVIPLVGVSIVLVRALVKLRRSKMA